MTLTRMKKALAIGNWHYFEVIGFSNSETRPDHHRRAGFFVVLFQRAAAQRFNSSKSNTTSVRLSVERGEERELAARLGIIWI